MKKIILVSLFLTLTFTACKKEETSTTKENIPNKEFAELLANYSEQGFKFFPLNATFAGDNRFNDQLPNSLSDDFRKDLRTFYSETKKELAQFKDEDLSATEKMSKAVLAWDCDINLETLEFREELLPINQMWTQQLTIGQFAGGTSAQPFNYVKDYKNWLKRVDAYIVWLDAAEERMREGMATGVVLPTSLIVKIIPQFEGLSKGKVEDHLFYTPVFALSEAFSQEDRDEITAAYTDMVANKIIPANKKMTAFLKDEYLPAGRSTSGINALPKGKEYYDHQIKLYTTTKMTADEIHQLGLSEVARITTEMEAVKEEVGFEGSLVSFFDYVRNRKELMPFTEPQQVLDYFNELHEKMKPQVDLLFDKQPTTPFEVRRTEAFREASASAEYNPGSIDGTRPGIFYTPIPDVTTYNVFDKEDLFLHEAIPGHHFQISLTQENDELPEFRKTLWYSAYGEGWALYTESMGKELGLYEDPYQYFGMLSAEMHRAIRLVVDTGLHSKGWTREQAIEYSLNHEAESEESITREIERYMANPGQALSYKIGQLKIMELRARATKSLGDKFDIKEFHNQVLETGCIPLALLENKIDVWIEASK